MMSIPGVTLSLIPRHQTMTEMATRFIRERVLSGHYTSGFRLIPAKLEAEFGLGRVAIREALRELTGSGLVISTPHKGAVVADAPSPEEVDALYEARYVLEGNAAYLATKKMTPEMIVRLESILLEMDEKSQSPFDYVLRNREFHLTLYEVSEWRSACRIINQLIDQVLIFRGLYSEWHTEDPKVLRQDHRRIIKALKAHAAHDAKKFVITNICRGYERLRHPPDQE
jgi:DNA-binding GntR family transcriptional regulator